MVSLMLVACFGGGATFPRSEFSSEIIPYNIKVYVVFLDTGLIYMWNRWQDPSTGRFISEDPAQAGSNFYAYGNNSPEVYIDPTGLDVYLLHSPWEAKGFGHVGVLVGDDENGWTYYSSDGRDEDTGNRSGPNHDGSQQFDQNLRIQRTNGGKGYSTYRTADSFFAAQQGNDESRSNGSRWRFPRDKAEFRKTTPFQDYLMKMKIWGFVQYDPTYYLFVKNCSQDARDILRFAGIPINAGMTNGLLPNDLHLLKYNDSFVPEVQQPGATASPNSTSSSGGKQTSVVPSTPSIDNSSSDYYSPPSITTTTTTTTTNTGGAYNPYSGQYVYQTTTTTTTTTTDSNDSEDQTGTNGEF